MKLYYLILLLAIISCKEDKSTLQDLVNQSIREYENELPKEILFYRTEKNSLIKNTYNYKFLTAKQLLDEMNEGFYELNIKDKGDRWRISIFSYKTGMSLFCIYSKSDSKLVYKSWEEHNRLPSKTYYIYYEIMKRKYPNYMNWDLFPIPKDSLK